MPDLGRLRSWSDEVPESVLPDGGYGGLHCSDRHYEWPGSPGPATWDGHPRCSLTGNGGDVARKGNEVSAGGPPGSAVGAERWSPPGQETGFMTHERVSGDGPSVDQPRHPRAYTSDLPVTGAWLPGDPVGNRQFTPVGSGRPFVLEGGGVLSDVTMAFETWGELSPAVDNAILVCHALTGDSHAYGEVGDGHATEGWWNGIIGPGCGIDTDRHFVVCVNSLGGCQGSTGPSSINPATGVPYGSSFPTVTTRDIVRCQAAVADHLGIDRWLAVVGGSMGGMQVLEWGVMFPHRVRTIAPIATTTTPYARWPHPGAFGHVPERRPVPRGQPGGVRERRERPRAERHVGVSRELQRLSTLLLRLLRLLTLPQLRSGHCRLLS